MKSNMVLKRKITYPTRVTMLDAVELDKEVFSILRTQLHGILKVIPPWIINEYETKLEVILQYFIWKLSVRKFHGTFGQQLLNMKYNEEELNQSKQYLLLMSKVFTYLHANNFFTFSTDQANETVRQVDIVLRLFSLANLLWFCCDGKYPTLTDRFLGLRPICITNKPRSIGYNYLTRELLWHGFIELLTFTLSVVNYQYVKRRIVQILSSRKRVDVSRGGPVVNLSTRCAICSKTPVVPQHMGCAHVFCYYCVQANRMVDSNFDCPACGYFQKDVSFIGH